MKRTVFILATVIFLMADLFQAKAQRNQDNEQTAGWGSEYRNARGPHGHMGMRGFYNMGSCDPELIEKRLIFDNELSQAEKEVIAEFRQNLPSIMEELYEKRQQQRATCDGEPIGRMRTEKLQTFTPIMEIAENHSERLESIADDHFNKMMQLRPKDGSGNQYGRGGNGKGRCDGTGQGLGKGRGAMHGNQHRRMNREDAGFMFGVHFLLMDTEKNMNTAQITQRKFYVIPNPANNSNELTYEVLAQGKVKIDILDKDGLFIKTVLDETKDKGIYTLNVNVSDLTQNLYFFRITDTNGTESVKFIVAR